MPVRSISAITYIFDDAVNIDADTAFVKHNDKYGILLVLKRQMALFPIAGERMGRTGTRRAIIHKGFCEELMEVVIKNLISV